jgi:hypothetical protein
MAIPIRNSVFVGLAATLVLTACGVAGAAGNRRHSPQTEPGARLKPGQGATISYDVGAGKGTAVITLTGVQQGKVEDLAAVELDAEDSGKVPFYLRYKVDNRGPTDARAAGIAGDLRAFDSGDQPLRPLVIAGHFPTCEGAIADAPFPAGTTRHACDVVLLAVREKVNVVRFAPVTGPYAQRPIVWRLSR